MPNDAKMESMLKLGGILNDFRWKSVPFVHFCKIHDQILTDWELTCQYLPEHTYSRGRSGTLGDCCEITYDGNSAVS